MDYEKKHNSEDKKKKKIIMKRKKEKEKIDNYFNEQRMKFGYNPPEREYGKFNSILSSRPNLYPEVDGDYLTELIPKIPPIKESVLDALEERAVMLMTRKAASGEPSCLFPIPELLPGFPKLYPDKLLKPLSERLAKRKNLLVIPKRIENSLFIELVWNS